jgi:Tfp pilus assembly protein FimV
MKAQKWGVAWCVAAALALAVPVIGAAQAQPAKPANATAQCKDGTYSTAKTKSGACSKHGGVGTWYADEKGAKADTKAAAADTKAAAKAAKTDTKADTKAAAADTKAAAKTATADTKAAAADTKAATKTAAKETKSAIATIDRPSDAPADATAQCNDGTYSKAKTHSGACSSHKGVKAWFK